MNITLSHILLDHIVEAYNKVYKTNITSEDILALELGTTIYVNTIYADAKPVSWMCIKLDDC